MTSNARVQLSYNLLRYSYGAVVLLAGLDKLFGTDLIVVWAKYISPAVADMLPFSTDVFLMAMGIIEIAVAIMLLTKFTRIGAYLSAAWLLLISVDLLMIGSLDIAIRDILLAGGAIVIAQLSYVVEDQRLT